MSCFPDSFLFILFYFHSSPNPVYITTESNLILIESWIFKNNSIFFRLELYFNNFTVCFKNSNIFDKVIFFCFVGIIGSSYLNYYRIPLFFIKRNMTGFLFGDYSRTRNFLNVYGSFYKTIFLFSTMRTVPILVQIFKSSPWGDIFFSSKRIVYIGTSGTGKFLHKIERVY